MLMQHWALNRDEAAAAAGLSSAQLKNFQTRYRVFPEKQEGTGTPTHYVFSDIMSSLPCIK